MESLNSKPETTCRTVLIVDDAPTNINIVNALLKGEYRTLVATSGKRALELAGSDRPPDLILLDIIMPGMDGYEVCRALKADPKTQQIPVIFLTGKAELDDEIEGFEAGCADFISKPISPPILRARVKTHLMLVEARELLRQYQGPA